MSWIKCRRAYERIWIVLNWLNCTSFRYVVKHPSYICRIHKQRLSTNSGGNDQYLKSRRNYSYFSLSDNILAAFQLHVNCFVCLCVRVYTYALYVPVCVQWLCSKPWLEALQTALHQPQGHIVSPPVNCFWIRPLMWPCRGMKGCMEVSGLFWPLLCIINGSATLAALH